MPRPAALLLVSLAALPLSAAADDPPLSAFYGFGELDILKVEDRSELLRAADLDGDGLIDLALADDSNSRLDLFLQRSTEAAGDAAEAEGADPAADPNALPDSARFEHVKLPVDRAALGLAVGDFTGDGRADLAYLGAPDRLILFSAPEPAAGTDAAGAGKTADWSAPADLDRTELRLPDIQAGVGLLAAGDLTGDGRTDLVVLGERVTYLLAQTEAGTLAAPTTVRNTSEGLSLAQIADLDGDGLADLSYTARVGDDRVLAARLQEPAAGDGDDGEDGGANTLGPELQFDLTDPRSVTFGEVFADEPGAEVLAVTGTTGRLTVRKVRRPKLGDAAENGATGLSAGRRLTQYGFGGRGDRDFAVGDLDGDGGADAVVTDGDGARVILFRQTGAGGLDLGAEYPSLAGASQVRVGDLDGDGTGELYVLSEKEGVIGRSVWEDGRLTFPVPVEGVEDPVAFTVLPNADGPPSLFAVVESDRRKFSLVKVDVPGGPAGDGLELDLSGDPDRLEAADVDGDGAFELILFPGRGKELQAYGVAPDGTVSLLKNAGLGPGEATPGELFAGRLPGPDGADAATTLVARGNLARDLAGTVGDDDALSWAVRDQFNAPEAAAKIAGAVTLDVDGEPGGEVVLIDTGVDKLRVFKRSGAAYEPAGEIETGNFPYLDAAVADFDSDGRDDLLLFGEGRFAVLYAGRVDPKLVELANYETDLDRSYLADSLVGDLNRDGAADVVVLDVRSHHVEILRAAGGSLERAVYWKLFEDKNFDGEGGGGLQPREGTIADVTGDGLPDLILLVHDRVLIYPQDPGTGEAGETEGTDG